MEKESKGRVWAARVSSGLATLFLLVDAFGKLVRPAPVVEGTMRLGYSEGVLIPLGLLLGTCTLLYVFPRTTFLGAILLTGYLGGAVASHVRMGDSLFSMLFPVVVGTVLWGGLWLGDARLRALVPLRT